MNTIEKIKFALGIVLISFQVIGGILFFYKGLCIMYSNFILELCCNQTLELNKLNKELKKIQF